MKSFIWISIQIVPQFYCNWNNKLATLWKQFFYDSFLANVEFRSFWLPQQTSGMYQITTLIELWCAQPDRCLQHVQNHGLTFQREIASPNTRCGTEIDGLISKRLAAQVWSVCSWTAFSSKQQGVVLVLRLSQGVEKWLDIFNKFLITIAVFYISVYTFSMLQNISLCDSCPFTPAEWFGESC